MNFKYVQSFVLMILIGFIYHKERVKRYLILTSVKSCNPMKFLNFRNSE